MTRSGGEVVVLSRCHRVRCPECGGIPALLPECFLQRVFLDGPLRIGFDKQHPDWVHQFLASLAPQTMIWHPSFRTDVALHKPRAFIGTTSPSVLSSPEFSPVEPRSRPLALLKSALSSNPLADLLPLLIRHSLPHVCLRKPARRASFRIRTPSRPLGSVQACSTERNHHLTREAGRRSLDARSWNNEALSTSAYSRYPEGPKRNTMQFHAHVPRC